MMRVIQMVDGLDYGDAVSGDVLKIDGMLRELGVESLIYSKYCDQRVEKYRNQINDYLPKKNDLVLYHFSGKSSIMDQALSGPPCIGRYHNITPPEFFLQYNQHIFEITSEGLNQIKENIMRFDGFAADSEFNRNDLISYGAEPDSTDVLSISVDLNTVLNKPYDKELLAELKKGKPYILFVGRMAPNKKIEDILDVFENYYRYHDKSIKLYLVGNSEHTSSYTEHILEKLETMEAKDNVIITGKVSDEALYAYYRGASAFLCMSEHEGFCVPLIEAQIFGIPVIGYNSCAVPDTMGKSGILLYEKDPALTAWLLDKVINEKRIRSSVLERQKLNVKRFAPEKIKKQLSTLLKKWEGMYYG